MENKNMGIIVEKVREIKGGILKDLESQIEKISNVAQNFISTNLKVYNVSNYLYNAVESGLLNSKQFGELFSWLVDREYEYFQEWESENLTHVKRKYIGRTSSFYYSCNFDNDNFTDVLEGDLSGFTLEDLLGDLENGTHILLFSEYPQSQMSSIISDFEEDEDEDDFESYLDNILSNEIEILENLSDELDDLYVAVLECEKAYVYLLEYKTKENECALAKDYLTHEIAEYYAEETAEKIFSGIISEHAPLNHITSIKVESVALDAKTSKYGVKVTSNIKEHTVSLELLEHELSDYYIECVLRELNHLISLSFDF